MDKQYLKIYIFLIATLFTASLTAQNFMNPVKNPALDNKVAISLKKFEGNIIIINIINSKIKDQVQKLKALKQKYSNSNIVFLVIDKDIYNKNINSDIFNSSLSQAEKQKIFNKYQTSMFNVFPIYVLVDENGKTIYTKKRTSKNINIRLSKKLDKLLKGKLDKADDLNISLK